MKKLVLLTLLTVSTYAVSFSQIATSKYSELSQGKFSFEQLQDIFDALETEPIEGSKNDTIYIKKFDNIDEYLDLNLGNNKLNQNQDNLNIIPSQETIYSMRIVKPTSNSPIQIYQPDSTIKYTLLIKDF